MPRCLAGVGGTVAPGPGAIVERRPSAGRLGLPASGATARQRAPPSPTMPPRFWDPVLDSRRAFGVVSRGNGDLGGTLQGADRRAPGGVPERERARPDGSLRL